MNLPIKIDTSELENATRQLAAMNGKDLSAALNKKMGWLLRRALWNTKKADKAKLTRELNALIYDVRPTKSGKSRRFLKQSSQRSGAPIVALLINSVRAKQGKKGLYGADMKAAVRRYIGSRQRSVAFLKSGIASALNPFLPFASGSGNGVPAIDRSRELRPVGKVKGEGIPAQPSSGLMVATSIDKTFTKRRGDAGLQKIAKPAFEKAYRDELADTVKYLNEQLYQTARKLGISAKR